MPDTIAGDATTNATLAVGGSVSSAIDTIGDHDWFAISLTAGTTYLLNMNGTGLGGPADTFLYLYNSSSTLVAFNDDFGNSTDLQIRFTATVSGTYYLDAAVFGNQSAGAYTLSAATAPAIPTYTLDQIADYLTTGYWGGPINHFSGGTITYSVQGLTAAEQVLARAAMRAWDDVASFTLVEVSGGASIGFDNSGSGIAEASSDGTSAVVHISSDWNGGDNSLGSYAFQTYLHEIGHALGLGHAGPYNGNATYGVDNLYQNDSWATTVMSYFAQDEAGTGTYGVVMGPQIADIIAIGNLYGLSTTTRTGDTTYGFNSNAGQLYSFADAIYAARGAPALTLFDNGGTDTFDLSGYSQNQCIDLNAEAWSDVGGKIGNIAIARGTSIENAIGGSGADTITGNAIANSLYGGAGADTINGNDGNDVIFAGAGLDILAGGNGDDTLVGNTDIFAQETDTINGGIGNDTIYGEFCDIVAGGAGTDYLYGVNAYGWSIDLGVTSIEWMLAGFGSDTINASTQTASVTVYAGGGNDVVTGGGFDDVLWAGVGNDTVVGGAGADIMIGDLGADSLSGGEGNDVIYMDGSDTYIDGGAGADALYVTASSGLTLDMAATHFEWVADFAGGNDTYNAAGQSVAATVYAGSGDDVIIGGAGNDFLWGEAGNEMISGGFGADVLVGGTGADWLWGATGTDVIYANSGGGGDGAVDTVVFDAPGFGTDFVFDFEIGIDKLNMQGTGASAGTITINNVAGHAEVHVGSDLIVVVGAGATLTTADFLF